MLTAPVELLRSTGTTTFSGALRSVCGESLNPLVDGDHRQAFRLARNALALALAEPTNPAPRIDLCAAAFLANRSADDDTGRRTTRDPLSGASYALATALHLRYHHVGQGEATAALLPAVVRGLDASNEGLLRRLAEALEVDATGGVDAAAAASAEALSTFYRSIGMPSRLSELGIPRDELPLLVRDAQKNFNANPGERADTLAEAHMRLRAAELAIRDASARFDCGQPCGEAANTAKFLAADAAFFACDHAMQTHGGFGYAREYYVERYWREARLMKIAPVSQEMVCNYIANHVLGLPRSY